MLPCNERTVERQRTSCENAFEMRAVSSMVRSQSWDFDFPSTASMGARKKTNKRKKEKKERKKEEEEEEEKKRHSKATM